LFIFFSIDEMMDECSKLISQNATPEELVPIFYDFFSSTPTVGQTLQLICLVAQ
jgi:hypothetical protein